MRTSSAPWHRRIQIPNDKCTGAWEITNCNHEIIAKLQSAKGQNLDHVYWDSLLIKNAPEMFDLLILIRAKLQKTNEHQDLIETIDSQIADCIVEHSPPTDGQGQLI
jgi:hypothetical protein